MKYANGRQPTPSLPNVVRDHHATRARVDARGQSNRRESFHEATESDVAADIYGVAHQVIERPLVLAAATCLWACRKRQDIVVVQRLFGLQVTVR